MSANKESVEELKKLLAEANARADEAEKKASDSEEKLSAKEEELKQVKAAEKKLTFMLLRPKYRN